MNKLNIFLLILVIYVNHSFGQIRAGSSFLKVLPGARVQAMANSHTGALDDIHSIYANPGYAGFIREWQWTASYTKWIADVYQGSFIYGRRIRTPWSRNSRFALGVLYQGIPEFDSSDHAAPNASANDLIASVSFGQPITKAVSLGTSIKYLHSKLDQFSTGGFVFDAGIFTRTPVFSLANNILKYGILSAGLSFTQLGGDMVFENVATPLPRTWRAGISFAAGSHHGLQIQLLADYHKTLDEEGGIGIGSEILLSRRLALNGGIDLNADLMNRASFGVSFQLDGSRNSFFPGQNSAIRMDAASMDEEEFFSRTYRGSVGHFTVGPESFRMMTPANGDTLFHDSVSIEWEETRDADLYDQIKYTLLCDHDSIKISQTIDELLENGISSSKLSSDSLDYLVQNIDKNSTLLTNMTGGYYYWAVFASDLDNHLRFAKIDGQRIAHFYIPYPDLVVDNISFEYYPYITENDFQGILKIHISNQGDKSATNVTTTLRDSIKTLEHRLNTLMDNKANNVPSLQTRKLSALDPGKKHVIEHQWHTPHLGLHEIKVHTRADENELIKNNNSMLKDFYTIPKGKVSTADSATVFLISKVSIDMPFITEIAFDKNSSKVKSIYLNRSIFDPHLRILAERLMTHPELRITLQGFADPNSENSSVELAMERANAVKDSLSSFGVDQNQIIVLPGQVLKKRAVPVDPVDAKWVFEERRYVKIHADQQAQSVLFAPVRHIDREEIEKSLKFITDIKYSRQLVKDMIKLKGSVIQDSIDMNLDKQTESTQIVEWTPTFDAENENMNREIKFTVKIKDDLDRTFYSKPDKVLLGSREYQREHRIAFPLKFAETDPLYDFYWERLFNQVKEILETPDKKIKFTGHACKIGPEDVNQRLSERRAKRFHNDFLNYVQNNHPEYALQILDMIKLPEGFGESQPLAIVRLSGRQIIIGDNSKPMGRMLNRRIEIRLY